MWQGRYRWIFQARKFGSVANRAHATGTAAPLTRPRRPYVPSGESTCWVHSLGNPPARDSDRLHAVVILHRPPCLPERSRSRGTPTIHRGRDFQPESTTHGSGLSHSQKFSNLQIVSLSRQ